MLDINANQITPQDGRRILGELLRPGALFAKPGLARILGNAQDTIHRQYLAGRRRNITFQNRKFVIEPLARFVSGSTAGKLVFEFAILAERDDYMMLHFSLLP